MTTKDIKYWLEEKELKTPIHDEMVIWSFANIKKILNELDVLPKRNKGFIINSENLRMYNEKSGWDWDKKEFIINHKEFKNQIKEAKKEYEKAKNNEEYFWEGRQSTYFRLKEDYEQIKTKKVEVQKDFTLFLEKIRERNEKEDFYKFNKKIEFSLYRGNWNIGFIDLMVACNLNICLTKYFSEYPIQNEGNEPIKYYLEIKPDVKSIGETIRQINFYRDYIPKENYKIILVTKTTGLKELFNTQNIFVYEYQDSDKLQSKIRDFKNENSST